MVTARAPFTVAELQALGKKALSAIDTELAQEITPLRSLNNAFYVDGPCELPSDAQKTKALAQIHKWNEAQVRAERNASTWPGADNRAVVAKLAVPAAKVVFGCVEAGRLLAKIDFAESEGVPIIPSQLDALLGIDAHGVRVLHSENGSSNHSEWARWSVIQDITVGPPTPSTAKRALYIHTVEFEGEAQGPIANTWFSLADDGRVVSTQIETTATMCDAVGEASIKVKLHERLALMCVPEQFDDVRWLKQRIIPSAIFCSLPTLTPTIMKYAQRSQACSGDSSPRIH